MGAPTEPVPNAEAGPLAREMAQGLWDMVDSYVNCGLSREEASAKVREPAHPDYLEIVLSRPPDEVSWFELENLLQSDPERAMQRWEEIKQAALEELRSGHRASQPIEEYASTPWKRVRFLALRQELADGWQPRTGVERQLLETMAQAQAAAEHWQGLLTTRVSMEAMASVVRQDEKRRWEPPRVSEAKAVEQAANMVDRFNRIFLRTLRALRDLHRGPQPVFVQNAGQVNVAQEQVNVAGGGGGATCAARSICDR
jgi:hypothetical protein